MATRVSWVLFIAGCISIAAAVDTQALTISGRVTSDSGQALRGATVLVIELDKLTMTDENGHYRFIDLPDGAYSLRIRHLGFETETSTLSVTSGTVVLDATLAALPIELQSITVIGGNDEYRRLRENMNQIPGSVALISPQEIRNTRQANLKDVLRFVPGVWTQPRFGSADESQVSVRGSGLRNNFHLRGINLLINGMPYRNADGFTDFESLELLTTDNVQVYKGGNALRYGGSTLGGAINLETKTGYTAPPVSLYGQAGSFGFYKTQLSSGQVLGDYNYYASYARTKMDGYRNYSGQTRDRFNLHLGKVLSPSLNARLFYLYAWVEEDLPGSLTHDEMHDEPRQATANNVTNRWGRDYSLHHLGVQIRGKLSSSTTLDFSPYVQYRDIVHPIFQVIDQISRDFGVEARLEHNSLFFNRNNELIIGLQWATGNIDDRRYINAGGKSGATTKDQENRAGTHSIYAEDVLEVTERLSTVVGVRADRSVREIQVDNFLSDGDQADKRRYDYLMPKVGVLYRFNSSGGQLYANASRSVEPPILAELNSLTVAGFLDIKAQDAWQYEIGLRGALESWAWDISAFDIELKNEIINSNVQPFPNAPFTVPTYRNVGRSRHLGLEVGLGFATQALREKSAMQHGVGVRAAYTFAQCKYVNDPVYNNNHIPGLPDHTLQAELTLRHRAGVTIRPTLEWVPNSYHVNSQNTDMNHRWFTLGVRGEFAIPKWGTNLFIEARNLTDEVYSASVNVDNGNARYYEPADARSVYAGFTWIR